MEEMTPELEQKIQTIYDKERVVQTINRHSYYMTNHLRQRELNELWVQAPEHQQTASLAYNNGYHVGMEAIRRQYVDSYEMRQMDRLCAICEKNPDVLYSESNMGYGIGEMMTATTPLVYIAGDGQSARYQGYALGYKSYGKPDGTADTYMTLGLIRADLLLEADGWKIWHLVLENDHTIAAGQDYEALPSKLPFGDDPLDQEFGIPTVEREINIPFFGWEHMWEDMPKPYDHYEDKYGYGPDSDLGQPYYKRDRR